ncbi:MAG TPA: CHAT domain-containing protein [Geminicoccaceae bacterium]
MIATTALGLLSSASPSAAEFEQQLGGAATPPPRASPAAGAHTLLEPGARLCRNAETTVATQCPGSERDGAIGRQPARWGAKVADRIDAGVRLLAEGRLEAAEAALEEARAGATEAGDEAALGTALLDLAHVALAQGQADRAGALLGEAQAAASCIAPDQRVDLVLARAALVARLPRSDAWDLEPDLCAACATARQRGDWRRASLALGLLGQLEERRGRYNRALAATDEALRALRWRGSADPWIEFRWQRQAGRLLELVGRRDQAISAYGAAADALERTRILSPADRELSPAMAAAFYDDYLARLFDRLGARESGTDAQDLLRRSVLTADRLTALEFERYFRSPCLPRASVAEPLPEGTAAIYPMVFADRTEILLIHGDDVIRFGPYAVGRARVQAWVEELRRLISQGTGNEYRTPAAALHDLLVREPSRALEGVDTLIFVPVDSLRAVPFAALYDSAAQRHLVERYAIAIAPTLGLITSERSELARPEVLAGFLAELGEGRGAQAQLAAQRAYFEDQMAGRTVILADERFTRANLRAELEGSAFNIVHVTSHADFSADVEGSFIQLADERLPLPDFLDLLERAKFRARPIELLVLAACRTAVGDASRNASLGLAGAGVKAGARSVLASLWRVGLQDATALTTAFYRALAAGRGRAMALRDAQLEVKDALHQEHPAHWAPFLLIGDWR